jgi:DNA-binding transcriptional LysR family regulator
MELRHLRYFIAVAEELSFTRAAERLYMAQPPLSTQIRALEQELEAQLFERDKRRVFLTQAGRHFLERARGILAAVETAKGEARSAASGEIGSIALGYTATSMLSSVLPTAIREFQREHPMLSLGLQEMTSLDQLDGVHAQALDIGILRRPDVVVPSGVVIEEWYQAPLVAAVPASNPLSAAPIRISDLRDQPMILYPRHAGIGLYWKVQELCAKAGFRPNMVQEARDASTIIGLVAAGVGIALVPADTECIRLEGVVYQRLLDKGAVATLHLAYRDNDRNPFVRLLLERLRRARPRRRAPRREPH